MHFISLVYKNICFYTLLYEKTQIDLANYVFLQAKLIEDVFEVGLFWIDTKSALIHITQ